jgi:hypothetical protein
MNFEVRIFRGPGVEKLKEMTGIIHWINVGITGECH